jgi:uncharacterized integral membrane protein
MYISLIVTFLLVLGITVFALQNDTIIAIKFFIWEYNYTQVAVILGSAVVGAAIMAIMTWPQTIKQHLKTRKLSRQVRELEQKHKERENQLMTQGEMRSPDVSYQEEAPEAASPSPQSQKPS